TSFLIIEKMDLVTKRRQIAGHCQGCRTCPYESNFFSIASERSLRHQMLDAIFVIGSHTLQTANSYRFFTGESSASASRLTRTIACAAKNAGKHVGVPVHHVGFSVFPFGN